MSEKYSFGRTRKPYKRQSKCQNYPCRWLDQQQQCFLSQSLDQRPHGLSKQEKAEMILEIANALHDVWWKVLCRPFIPSTQGLMTSLPKIAAIESIHFKIFEVAMMPLLQDQVMHGLHKVCALQMSSQQGWKCQRFSDLQRVIVGNNFLLLKRVITGRRFYVKDINKVTDRVGQEEEGKRQKQRGRSDRRHGPAE